MPVTSEIALEAEMDEAQISQMSEEQIYQFIGTTMAEAIPTDDWLTAELIAEIEEDDNGLLSGSYWLNTNSAQRDSFRANVTLYFAMDELRNRMQRSGQQPWMRAKFILQRSGRFDLELTYPDENSR